MSRRPLAAVTVFLSAALLMAVQPMAGKRVLPWFGGGAAVWTTAMLLFQTLLLVGYAYAHALGRTLRPRRGATVHAILLATAAVLVLTRGVLPGRPWTPAGDATQSGVLITLAASVGLPYVLLSATAPLVQTWLGGGRGAYRLYALSNAGSLLALVSYPLLIEPWTPLTTQGRAWGGSFVAFAGLCVACAWRTRTDGPAAHDATDPSAQDATDPSASPPRPPPDQPDATADRRPSRLDRSAWLALPACASAALLAITNHLCQDVAPVPLLWVGPLVVYLLTFVLAFEGDRWSRRGPWTVALAVTSVVAAVGWWPAVRWPFGVTALIDLALLLSIGMLCHGETARRRPATAHATAFYLSLSAGGVLGGVLVAVVAPRTFDDFYELPLVLLAAWGLAMLMKALDRPPTRPGLRRVTAWTGSALFTVVLSLVAWGPFSAARAASLEQGRDFFGVFKVQEGDLAPGVRLRRMMHGPISHGAQFTDAGRRREPAQYYDPTSGIGRLMATRSGPKRVGVVGLGTGTIAAFAEAGDRVTFYEISPVVIGLAERDFTYLADARQRGATVDVTPGDGRLALQREAARRFDVLVLDAFSGDAVPVHLLTREAFAVYRRHLAPGGVLAVNVTNHNVDLLPVLIAAAADAAAELRVVRSTPDAARAVHGSTWTLLYTGDGPRVGETPAPLRPVAWTDERSSLLSVLKWR